VPTNCRSRVHPADRDPDSKVIVADRRHCASGAPLTDVAGAAGPGKEAPARATEVAGRVGGVDVVALMGRVWCKVNGVPRVRLGKGDRKIDVMPPNLPPAGGDRPVGGRGGRCGAGVPDSMTAAALPRGVRRRPGAVDIAGDGVSRVRRACRSGSGPGGFVGREQRPQEPLVDPRSCSPLNELVAMETRSRPTGRA
jgi:hypothetical protein